MSRRRALMALAVAVLAGPALAAGGGGGLARLDANHDGVVSRQEAIAAQKRAFARFDANGDGRISWSEFKHSRPGEAPAERDKAQRKQRERVLKRWFHNLDSNGDDRISLSEYLAGTMPYFNRLDSNGDGVVDGKEMEQAFQSSNRAQHR